VKKTTTTTTTKKQQHCSPKRSKHGCIFQVKKVFILTKWFFTENKLAHTQQQPTNTE